MKRALLLIFSCAAQICAAEGHISGRVRDAVTGRPVASVVVTVTDQNQPSPRRGIGVTTGPDGSFSFDGLPPGSYTLGWYSYWRHYASQTQRPDAPGDSRFLITGATRFENILLTLHPSAGIEGTVHERNGLPSAAATVFAISESMLGSGFSWQQTTADTHGRFTFAIGDRIAPGRYIIAAMPRLDPNLRQIDFVDGTRVPAFTFYGDTAELQSATPVTVTTGETAIVDIRLLDAPVVRAKFSVKDTAGAPEGSAVVIHAGHSLGPQIAHGSMRSSTVDFGNLPAGRYIVRTTRPGLSVGGQTVELQRGGALPELVFRPALSWKVRIQSDCGPVKADPALYGPLPFLWGNPHKTVQGGWLFERLTSGRYMAAIGERKDGARDYAWYVSSIATASGVLEGAFLDITDSTGDVQLNASCGAAKVRVVSVPTSPTETAPILTGVGMAAWQFMDHSTSIGEWLFEGVAPGEYDLRRRTVACVASLPDLDSCPIIKRIKVEPNQELRVTWP